MESMLSRTDQYIRKRNVDGVLYVTIPVFRLRSYINNFSTVSKKKIRWGQPESDIKECDFYLAQPPDKDWPVLMRRTDPTQNETPDEGGVLECIAENVLGLNLLYHDGVGWCDDWLEERRGRPLAIRIELAVLAKSQPPKIWTISRVVSFPHRGAQNQQESEEE